MKLALRSMITAPPGKALIAFDLSQAESWVVAYLANEPNMKHSLLYGDIHTETAGNALFYPDVGCGHVWKKDGDIWRCNYCASEITKIMRYTGKKYNHASAYRMGPEQAARSINKESDQEPYLTVTVAESKKFSAAWHQYYNLKGWWAEIERELSATRTLVNPFGRVRTFYAMWGPELLKEATANIPQSTVADHFNGATIPGGKPGGLLVLYRKYIKPYSDRKICNQSHDSAILEVPQQDIFELIPQIRDVMLRPITINGESFTIPLDIEAGERWGELESCGKV